MVKRGVQMQEVNLDGSLTKGTFLKSTEGSANAGRSKFQSSSTDGDQIVFTSKMPNVDNALVDEVPHGTTESKTAVVSRSIEDIIARHPAHKKERNLFFQAKGNERGSSVRGDVALLYDVCTEDEREQHDQERLDKAYNLGALCIGDTFRDVIVETAAGYDTENLRLMANCHIVIIRVPQSFCEMLGSLERYQASEDFRNVISGWICLLVITFIVESSKKGSERQPASTLIGYELDYEGMHSSHAIFRSGETTGNRSARTPSTLDRSPTKRRSSMVNSFRNQGLSASSSGPVDTSPPDSGPPLYLSKILVRGDWEPVHQVAVRGGEAEAMQDSHQTGEAAADQSSHPSSEDIIGLETNPSDDVSSVACLRRLFTRTMLSNMGQFKPVDCVRQAVVELQDRIGLVIDENAWGRISELTLLRIVELIFTGYDVEEESALKDAVGEAVARETDSEHKKKLLDLKVPDLIFLLKNSGLEAFIPTVSILGMDGGNLIKLASDGDSWNRAFEAFTKPERENLKALVDKWAKNGLWSPGIA
jgi:hypothetical protein